MKAAKAGHWIGTKQRDNSLVKLWPHVNWASFCCAWRQSEPAMPSMWPVYLSNRKSSRTMDKIHKHTVSSKHGHFQISWWLCLAFCPCFFWSLGYQISFPSRFRPPPFSFFSPSFLFSPTSLGSGHDNLSIKRRKESRWPVLLLLNFLHLYHPPSFPHSMLGYPFLYHFYRLRIPPPPLFFLFPSTKRIPFRGLRHPFLFPSQGMSSLLLGLTPPPPPSHIFSTGQFLLAHFLGFGTSHFLFSTPRMKPSPFLV